MTLGEYLGGGSGTTTLLYHLNGNANDSSGNGINGTVSGATAVAGKFGQGYSFTNGQNHKITIPNTLATTFDGVFTISLRAKCTNDTVAVGKVRTMFDNYQTGGNKEVQMKQFGGTNKLYVHFWNGTTAYQKIITAPDMTQRHNYILVRTSTTNYKIYVDGVDYGDTTISNNDYTNQNPCIGYYNNAANTFDGTIDEVIIENIARDAVKIKKYYTYAKGRFGTL